MNPREPLHTMIHRKKPLALPFVFLLLLLCFFGSCALPPPAFDEEAWRSRVLSSDPDLLYAPNYRDKGFFNPWMPEEEKSPFRLLRWRLTRPKAYTDEEKAYLPRFIPDAKERILARPHDDFILWVGHGTFLIRVSGQYWLVDPLFSRRAFLPKRKVPPGISAEEIRQLAPDLMVILTHNHYDHFDKKSVLALPDHSRFVVPLGLKKTLERLNKRNVTEMAWWEELDLGGGVRLVCLPMQHWSRRIGQGYNETLWASFLLITPQVTLYLGGDTGYFVGYKEIGRRFPGIDYALLPTTAFHPRWFMHYNHMDIEETLMAFQDLDARFMIPQQWGTLHLGDEPPGYPVLELKKAIRERRLDPDRFLILNIGDIHWIRRRER